MTRRPRVVWIRLAGVALLTSAAWYVPWMVDNADWSLPWLSVPFVLANLLVVVTTMITLVNNWHRSAADPRPVPDGCEPSVAVIVPTCGEPVWMVVRTVVSVLEQDWPDRRLLVLVSDDGHNPELAAATRALRARHPEARILYHEPPVRGDADRRGDAKAGNLNSALDQIAIRAPHIEVIETRDADDEVGDPTFLRHAVGQLGSDRRVAYVQTVKEARVGAGDPFGNNDPMFYRGAMYARHASNAVFPCGSGLVWRAAALRDIGGFPTWNLVEDLQSGVEALRRGWRGVYLPIVGAVGQTAPEDIPNVYKQRGTWALDTMRLLLFGDLRGLSIRQRLQFAELGLFYAMSVATLILVICPVVALVFERYPLVTTDRAYITHFWPFALSVEALLAALATGHRYETLWRARQIWIGMAPVYAKACLLAVRYGRHRKPTYRVTRKNAEVAWYWRETLPQALLVGALVSAVAYGATTSSLVSRLDAGSAYWALFAALFLAGFVRRSWYGVDWREQLLPTRGLQHDVAGQVREALGRTATAPSVAVQRARTPQDVGVIDLTDDRVIDLTTEDERTIELPSMSSPS